MLAIYGKGGMGKSFFTSNLTARLTFDGFRVMQLGCDPKHDSCNTIFGGYSLPTLGEQWRLFKEAGKEDQLAVGDVIFRNELRPSMPIFGCELGGPEVGRGCGGQGISSGFKTLEGLGMSKWDLDYIVMDFLGDVVCGGFATPLARSLAEHVIIVVGHDRQSLYAANNIAKAAQYFRSMGGSTQVLGLVVNRDDGSDTADLYAQAVGLPILARVPLSRKVRELADACKLALEDAQFNAIFGDLAGRIARREIDPCTGYTPLEYDEFLRVFGAAEPDGSPVPASADELFGKNKKVGGIPTLTLTPIIPQVQLSDPVLLKVQRMIESIGLHVTDMDRSDKDGITVTSGALEMRLGADEDLDSKVAFLSALRRSGQEFTYIDLRYADAPSYR
ncbi:MAG TPA: chlorophyllide a reductase iron protein subunit X [Kouleothrix sp.]|uniref:chlorophyllide a reductase iron protein subunit X n=1 Tax=Kouleothrix sp. TaxID=2779161 RepID=UPI002BE113B5|nr:chlorophyllide a reductase iron protein subunit X [Kouleothrix sp.]HRC76435.1 chlorophyllide a reductase iron protein subunit X [Kouleothrix sp.]